MTRIIARLILAMLLLPASIAVFVVAFAIALRKGDEPSVATLLAVWGVVYTFIAVYWVLLWRRSVRWTAARISRTVIAALGALGAGFVFGAGVVAIANNVPTPLSILMGGGIVPIVWVLATVLLWSETPAERLERISGIIGSDAIVCPICGYNLSGLREARCPECGAAYTLDRLIAAQPGRESQAAEL